MIIIIAAAIYLPNIGKKPATNFLYVTGDAVVYDYYNSGNYYYTVQNGRVEKDNYPYNPNNPKPYSPAFTESQIYLYDAAKNLSTELSLSEAQQYQLDPGNQSPDGYVVERGSGGGGFPFGGAIQDYNSWYLKGHNRSFKLNLKLIGSYAYNNFKFLGWVK